MIKKCKVCDGRLRPALIDYEKEILGDIVVIPKVEGFICSVCKNKQIDEKIEGRLQVRILEEKLKLKKEKKDKTKPILINNIKKIRTDKELSQKIVGEALGYTEQRFGAVERNDNTPIIYAVKQIADTLGVNDSDLYTCKYISIELYDILKDMNNDLVIIDGLPETRKDFEAYHAEYENVKEQYNEYKREKRELEKRNSGIIKKVPFVLTEEIMKENEKRLKVVMNEINDFEVKILNIKDKAQKGILKNELKELKKEERRLKRELSGKAKTRDYILTEKLKKDNDKRIKELDELLKPLKAEINKMFKVREKKKEKLDLLINGTKTKKKKIKGSILRQGYCIEYDDWQKVKEVFKKYLPEDE